MWDPRLLAAPGPVLVEGGHFTLSRGALSSGGEGEPVDVAGVGRFTGGTTETTRETFARSIDLVKVLRARGTVAAVGLMVGDLAVPSGSRVPGGSWALPASYRALLVGAGLGEGDVHVWGEAFARNQGKRRLLDEADTDAEVTYAAHGWALLQDRAHVLLASDASLEWDGDTRAAVLTRRPAPLCPLVFAGLKRAIFQSGFRTHVAVYAVADDPWIDVKLRAASTAFAQLYRGDVGLQVDLLAYGAAPRPRFWDRAELRAPGERPWPDFLADVQRFHPGAHPLEVPCPTSSSPSMPACLPGTTTSRCSG